MKVRRLFSAVVAIILTTLFLATPSFAYANDEAAEQTEQKDTVYYLGDVVNTGLDNGFGGADTIKEGDPRFGWDLGSFYVKGFTSKTGDDAPIFLKNNGDQVALYFVLNQNIDALNGKEELTISEDKDGYDEYFGVPKTNFGRGALIIKHSDY